MRAEAPVLNDNSEEHTGSLPQRQLLASLHNDRRDWPRFAPQRPGGETLGGGLATVSADPGVPLSCLPSPVKTALTQVAARFGPVVVRSTQRVWKPGKRRRSMHLDCRAADIRVMNAGAVLGFLRQKPELGGVKRYSNGLIHIDNGPKRSW